MTELSKGTSQKVAVAQALLADPALLVLDEAWTGLDTGARTELDTAVRERLAAGATVVFVDHDPRRLEGRPGSCTGWRTAGYGRRRGRSRGPSAVRRRRSPHRPDPGPWRRAAGFRRPGAGPGRGRAVSWRAGTGPVVPCPRPCRGRRHAGLRPYRHRRLRRRSAASRRAAR
ncbi:hypothetical protein O1L60_29785 [Streptomyces diastatochromogenes]|nr:hypothetical protein [Streptomyces diastatochromogenes]